MSQKIPLYYSLPAIILSTLLIAAIIYAWTEPTQAPPGGNVPVPINVSGDSQYKLGALGIGGLFQTDTDTHLAITGGNVGIGTMNPGAKLEVDGQIKITDGNQGDGKVLTSDADGLASWQPAPGGGGTSFVTFTPSISYSTCVQYANYNTWGDIYPDAVAAGYELSQCVPLTTFPGFGQSTAGGWIAYRCYSPTSACMSCYQYLGRAYSPGPFSTWISPVGWLVVGDKPYVTECRVTPIRCIQ